MKTEEQRQRFVELRSSGHSLTSISKEIGVSRPTLSKWLVELENDIETFRYHLHEAMIERYRLGRAKRLESLVLLMERIEGEMAGRNLSEMSIRDLFLLKAEVQADIKSELEGCKLHTGEKGNFIREMWNHEEAIIPL